MPSTKTPNKVLSNDLNLRKIAKRTGPVNLESRSDVDDLQTRLLKSDYPPSGKLHKRLIELHCFINEDLPKALLDMEKPSLKIRILEVGIAAAVGLLILAVLSPISEFFAQIVGVQRLSFLDPAFNIMATLIIVFFGLRQIIREREQRAMKKLVDALHTKVHLLDMHQLAKGKTISPEVRTIIGEAILICAKVASALSQRSDDTYVVSSAKHLEVYAEMVAQRNFFHQSAVSCFPTPQP